MRIALTGSHRTGKSSLLRALVEARPGLSATIEPYYHLERLGYTFLIVLSLDDFVEQLESSLRMLEAPTEDVVFDRCPLDFLGYIVCHRTAKHFAFEEWIPRIQESLRTLDLLVRVPIETPDRIAVPLSAEETGLRKSVDRAIHELLGTSVFTELGTSLLTVTGSIETRAQTVLRFIQDEVGES